MYKKAVLHEREDIKDGRNNRGYMAKGEDDFELRCYDVRAGVSDSQEQD